MTTIVQQVPPILIRSIWDRVQAYLEASVQHNQGVFDLSQLKMLLVEGRQILLVAIDDERNIHGACTIVFEDYPNARYATVTNIGGHLIAKRDLFNQLVSWCKGQGCTHVYGLARDSVARLWNRLGVHETGDRVVRMKL